MEVSQLLVKLERVKPTTKGQWQARCPAHNDRNPSLSIRELDDGRVLIHCFAGCSVHEILSVLNLTFNDLYPVKNQIMVKGEKHPFTPKQVLIALAHEVLVVAVAASQMAQRGYLETNDLERLKLAYQRIQNGVDMAGVEHG